jgi:hypothetical protein
MTVEPQFNIPDPPPGNPQFQEFETLDAPSVLASTASGIGTGTGTSLAVTGVTGIILPGMVVTGTGIPANTTIVKQTAGGVPPADPGGAGTYTTSVATTASAAALTFAFNATVASFPEFTPFFPPPPLGGTAPSFPPPSIPPPAGALVGPAVPQQTGTGHTSPSYTNPYVWPGFSSVFPNPTVVFSNVWTVPTISGGLWTTHLPPATASTLNVSSGGWGPPGPTGSGTGPPSYPNPPGAGLPHMTEAEAMYMVPGGGMAVDTSGGGPTTAFIMSDNGEHYPGSRRRRRRL